MKSHSLPDVPAAYQLLQNLAARIPNVAPGFWRIPIFLGPVNFPAIARAGSAELWRIQTIDLDR